jgi:hypothetical protein
MVTKMTLHTSVAKEYRTRGWVPLRLQGKSPQCMGRKWSERTLANDLPAFQHGDNIGILLGPASGNLVRLDPDWQSIPAVTEILWPEPTLTFGRAGAPLSGRLIVSELKSQDFTVPSAMKDHAGMPRDADGKPKMKVFQILAGGKQTMAPPSIHPDNGELVEWQVEGNPVQLDPVEVVRRAGLEAFLMLVRQFWPAQGTRNEAAMALSRVLLGALAGHAGGDDALIEMVDALVIAVAEAGGDGAKSREGKARARATLEKIRAGDDATGMPALLDLLELPAGLVKTLRKWIGQGELEVEPQPKPKPRPKPPARTLDDVHKAFRKWLGEEYDLDAIDAVCAAAATERLDGDPLWLLLVGGPGGAKTETVQSLVGAGALSVSTIASEGALLSGTSRRERAVGATGGLLRQIGDRGLMVIKDFTTILSQVRETRGMVLAAIREIYDGRWTRNVGTDGGKTLNWSGRLVIVGAVTTAWDQAHAVVATMGDRFVLLRLNSTVGRVAAGQQAMRNVGHEVEMRNELRESVGGLVCNARTEGAEITNDEHDRLLKAANIVTVARTAVERNYNGDVIDAHEPEMPTRYAKQLTQMMRGALAIGTTRDEAMRLALRCARDSIPPLRLAILLDVAAYPWERAVDVSKRIHKPPQTTRREMDGLNFLGLLACDAKTETKDGADRMRIVSRYGLAPGLDLDTLLAFPRIRRPQEVL